MNQQSLPKQKLFFVLTLFALLLGGILKSQAQSASGISIEWNSEVSCQLGTFDDKRLIYLENMQDDICLNVCKNSTVLYTLNDLPPNSTTTWTVTGGVKSNETNENVTVNWNGTGESNIIFTITTDTGVITKKLCIKILINPAAKFKSGIYDAGQPIIACSLQYIYFTNLSSSNGGSDIILSDSYWDFGDGTTINAANPVHQYTAPGHYVVYLTVKNSCSCEDTMRTDVYIEDKGFDITCPSIVCEGEVARYSLPQQATNACGTFNWQVNGGTIVGNANSPFIDVLWNQPNSTGFGEVTFFPSQCSLPCLLPTTIRVPIIKNVGTIAGTSSICLGQQAHYTMPEWPTTDFQWQIIGNTGNQLGTIIQTDQRNEIIVTPTQAGAITLYVKYYNTLMHCGGTATLTINVKSPEPFTGDSVVCLGSTGAYATVSGSAVEWTLKNSSGVIIDNLPSGATYSYPFTAVGNYSLTVSGSTICSGQTKSITVPAALVAPTLYNAITTVCPNAPYTYTVTNPDGNSEYEWSIVNGNFIGNDTGPQVTVTFQGAGQLKVRKKQVVPVPCESPYFTQNIAIETIQAFISNSLVNTSPIVSCSNNYFSYNVINTTGGIYSDTNSTYTWSITPSTAGSISSGQGTKTVEVLWNSVTATAYPTLTVVINKCTVTQAINKTITVTPTPSFTLGGPTLVCSGNDISFTVVPNPTTPLAVGTQITWSFNTILPYPGGLTTTKNFNNGSSNNISYTVTATITNPNGCNGTITASKNFTVTPGPVATAINTTGANAFCHPEDVFVQLSSATTTGASIQWYKNNTSTVLSTAPSFTVNNTLNFGNYFFKATKNGCSTTSNIISIIQNCIEPELCQISTEPIRTLTCTNTCGLLSLTGTTTGNPISVSWSIIGPELNIANVASNNGPNAYQLQVEKAGQYTIIYSTTYIGTNGQPCTINDIKQATVAYVPDFRFDIHCGAVTDTYNVTIVDNSSFFASVTNSTRKFKYEKSTNPLGPWTLLSNFSSTPNFTLPANYAAGSVFIRQTIKGSIAGTPQTECSKVLTLFLPSMAGLTISYVPPLCYDTAVKFKVPSTSVSNGDTFKWTFDTTAVQNTNPEPTRVFDPSLAGGPPVVVKVTVTNKYGCEKELTTVLNPVQIPAKCFSGNLIATPTNATVCQNELVKLEYIPGNLANECAVSSYIWMDGTTVVATTVEPIHWVSTPGFYTVTVVSGSDCKYQSPTIITPVFLNLPSLTLNGSSTICLGDDAGFNVVSNADFIYWTIDTVPTGAYDGLESITLSNLPLGIHTVKVKVVSAEGCEQEATQTFEVVPAPSQLVLYPPVLVNNDCEQYIIHLEVANVATTGFYTWSNGASGSAIDVNQGGTYQVTYTNEGGCSSSQQVVVPKSPKAYMWVFPTGCYDKCKDEEAYLLGPTLPVNVWKWYKDQNVITFGNNSIPTNLILQQSGTYNLSLNTGLCDFISEPMSLNASDCVACPIEIIGKKINPLQNGYCGFTVLLEINNNSGAPIPAAVLCNSNDLIISSGNITLTPGPNTVTVTILPINGFNGGTVDMSIIGNIPQGNTTLNCSTLFNLTVPPCSANQARTATNTETEPTHLSAVSDILLYPNPATDKVNIRFETDQMNSQVEVYDLTGRLMSSYQTTTKQGVWELDLAPMATGVYVVVLRNGTQILMQRKLQVL